MVKHSNSFPLKAKAEYPLKHPAYSCLSELRSDVEDLFNDHFSEKLKVTSSYSGEVKFQGEYEPLLFVHGRRVLLRLYVSGVMTAFQYPFCTIADIETRADQEDLLDFLYEKVDAVVNENRDKIEESLSEAYEEHLQEVEDEREHRYYVRTHAL